MSRRALFHEVTHWDDMAWFTDADRAACVERYGWPDVPWFWPAGVDPQVTYWDPNCERLAAAGEQMYLHPHKYKWLRQRLREARGNAH